MERRKKLGVITHRILNNKTEFFTMLRRFSQSKFHFDFEDDSRLLRIKFAKANLA
jgi:hypothetical protein